jgi:hypothetical protein
MPTKNFSNLNSCSSFDSLNSIDIGIKKKENTAKILSKKKMKAQVENLRKARQNKLGNIL